ncbi:MAG: DegT/DnrJ/EryC1/StrS aminotransferase family protein [Gammaproteobacteria bacterium]|nr:DegT/DnrJ/EryC1/StrS aminotransferase family protein [Gammaproteobacteria bacterium]
MNLASQRWPLHSEDEILAVDRVLASGCTNYWAGQECREFEKEFAHYIGADYAVALMNGTVALEAALRALKIGPGDEVITTCRTFIASASCIVLSGATPVMADVDPISQNISAETIAPCITPRTKAIIVVHLAGWPADMKSILALAEQHHIKVIEDCAQSHGAAIKDKRVGSWGHVAAFSFCQDKILTTGGEGGMITTNDKTIFETIRSFKDHGKNFEKVYQQHPPGFRWLHDSFGTNWRMTEMQAAIGRVQLKKLPEWLSIRKRNADILNASFQSHPALKITLPPADILHAYYKYYVFLNPEKLHRGWSRDQIIAEVNASGVACFSGSCSEIYLEEAFLNHTEFAVKERKTIAKRLGETSLMFLVHPTLTATTIQHAADTLLDVLERATEKLCA